MNIFIALFWIVVVLAILIGVIIAGVAFANNKNSTVDVLGDDEEWTLEEILEKEG